MNSFIKFSFLSVFLLFILRMSAQPPERLIKIHVSPDHTDWTYKPGEKVTYTVTVTRNEELVPNCMIRYEIGQEKMTPMKKDSMILTNGTVKLDGGTMTSEGFTRCVVSTTIDGKIYRGLATAGFNPLNLKPVVKYPADFLTYWDQAKASLAKVPMDARMTLMPERCTEKSNVYHVNLQNYRDGGTARLYGILCVPKAEGKYPALLRVPGAGVRPYNGDVSMADRGVITFEIGIHGVPVNMDPVVYQNLGAGPLAGYWVYNLDDKDKYYYKRVYLGCIRANDFINSLPQYDGSNLAVMGSSQGGALSIVTAGLDSRVKYLAAIHPAMSDMAGYTQNRAGGWPHMFDKNNAANLTESKLTTASYYDVVNFARQIKVPGRYAWGFNDETCPPTSMYPAYNIITAPKDLWLYLDSGHWIYPEESERLNNWVYEMLTKK
ncbi:MAG: acetylxylan esterase [Saprospiraceae bacterium]|nr:acetylxylan esterase [Saprospiraceae bacterium]